MDVTRLIIGKHLDSKCAGFSAIAKVVQVWSQFEEVLAKRTLVQVHLIIIIVTRSKVIGLLFFEILFSKVYVHELTYDSWLFFVGGVDPFHLIISLHLVVLRVHCGTTILRPHHVVEIFWVCLNLVCNAASVWLLSLRPHSDRLVSTGSIHVSFLLNLLTLLLLKFTDNLLLL